MKKLKVIIFDYDLTLYNVNERYHNNYWVGYTTDLINNITYDITLEERGKFLKKYNLNKNRSVENFAKACTGMWGNCERLLNYMMTHDFEQDYENMTFIDSEIIEKLSEKYNLYIISNAPSTNIIRQLRDIAGINPNLFKEVLTNPHNKEDNTKAYVIKQIIAKENVNPDEVLMLGDNMEVDVIPAINIGVNAKLVKKLDEILPIINEAENTCKI